MCRVIWVAKSGLYADHGGSQSVVRPLVAVSIAGRPVLQTFLAGLFSVAFYASLRVNYWLDPK